MGNVLVQESSLQAIAAAIRNKNGLSSTYKPVQMAAAITAIDIHPGLLEPHVFDLDTGYVYNSVWKIGGTSVNYSDVYQVQANKPYLISLGGTVGTRFRSLFTETDTSVATSDISGTNVTNITDPDLYASKVYIPPSDGYITITKDNEGQAGIKSYVVSLHDYVDSIL